MERLNPCNFFHVVTNIDRGCAHAGNQPVVLTIGSMVNHSIAHRLLNGCDDEAGQRIIGYDFIEHKPNSNFWANLKRVNETHGGSLTQYSFYITESLREAKAVGGLVKNYTTS